MVRRVSSGLDGFKKAENAILEQIFFRNLKLKPHELRILIPLYHIIHLPMFRIRFHYDADPDPRLHWTKFGLKGQIAQKMKEVRIQLIFLLFKKKFQL